MKQFLCVIVMIAALAAPAAAQTGAAPVSGEDFDALVEIIESLTARLEAVEGKATDTRSFVNSLYMGIAMQAGVANTRIDQVILNPRGHKTEIAQTVQIAVADPHAFDRWLAAHCELRIVDERTVPTAAASPPSGVEVADKPLIP